jgi:hypothetical protein
VYGVLVNGFDNAIHCKRNETIPTSRVALHGCMDIPDTTHRKQRILDITAAVHCMDVQYMMQSME